MEIVDEEPRRDSIEPLVMLDPLDIRAIGLVMVEIAQVVAEERSPSLAKREVERERAIQAYHRLAVSALRRVRPGGVLVSASCSAHVSAEEFFGALREAARSSGRKWTDQGTTGHPPDHPARIPEAQYLKAIYLKLS